MTQAVRLYVKPSTFGPRHGNGLFTFRNIKADSLVGVFKLTDSPQNTIAYLTDDGGVVHVSKSDNPVLGNLNDSRLFPYDANDATYNVRITCDGHIYATRDIPRFSELFARFTNNYHLGRQVDCDLCFMNWREYFEIKTSTIPGAGRGVFALKPIPKNVCIMMYSGVLYTSQVFEKRIKETDCKYILEAVDSDRRTKYIDCNPTLISPEHCGPAGFLNDCQNPYQRAVLTHLDKKVMRHLGYNVYFDNYELYTLRHIQPGEELFVDYGDDYWSEHKPSK